MSTLKRWATALGLGPASRRQGRAHPPRVPDGTRVYAIGDIHGRMDLLAHLHGQIAEDMRHHPDRVPTLVYLGDYVDRGPDSRAVLECLSTGPFDGVHTVCLLGNHEDAMLSFLSDPEAGAAWLDFGAVPTLASYGVETTTPRDPDALDQIAAALGQALPDHHRRFLTDLKLFVEVGDYLFVHAGIRPGVPPDLQAPEDLLYIREPFLSSTSRHAHRVVHGHTVTDEPVIRANRIGIDTGAFATGCLTCLVLDGASHTILST